MPGSYDLPKISRGDTFPSFAIATLTDFDSGAPIPVSSATLQVRTRPGAGRPGGQLLMEWSTAAGSITLSGASHIVTLGGKSASVMAGMLAGTHDFDLEVVLVAGNQTLTLLGGTWLIEGDITRPA